MLFEDMMLKIIPKKDMKVLKESIFTTFTMLLLMKVLMDNFLIFMYTLMTKKD